MARGRVAALVSSHADNPLPTLAEIRFYHALGLIGDVELRNAYDAVLGEPAGRQLYDARPATVKSLLAKWLPRK